MRTREEQIDSLYHDYTYTALSRSDFRDHILEAERRAEQRIRASERERCVAAVQSEQLIDVAPDCSDDMAYNVAIQHAVAAIQRLGDAT